MIEWLHFMLLVDIKKQFGLLVKRRRKEAGLSQEGLAVKAGLHPTYISMLERSERLASLIVLQKLAKALGTTMTALIAELERLK